MGIRELVKNEIELALELTWEVFQNFESPDYSEQGINEFYRSIHDQKWLSSLKVFGAFEQNEIIGVIATRNNGNHIALFFVKGEYQKQGVGRKLFERILHEDGVNVLTVNSSPYAVPVYHKFGFQDVDVEQTTNGIKYTPMKMTLFNILLHSLNKV